MTLRERLKELGDEVVYVGANSGFFFIGTAKDGLNKRIRNTEREYYNIIQRSIHKRRLSIEECPKRIKEYENSINSCLREIEILQKHCRNEDNKKKKNKLLDDIFDLGQKVKISKSLIEKNARRIEWAKETLPEYEERLKNFIHFMDREVIDEYPRRFIEPFGRIIIIEGDEVGKLWFVGDSETESEG